MRKSKPISEELQSITALDKAQRELKQAIELSEMREKKDELHHLINKEGIEGDVAEFIEHFEHDAED